MNTEGPRQRAPRPVLCSDTTRLECDKCAPRRVAARQGGGMASCSFCDSRAELVDRAIHLDAENRRLRKQILEIQAQRGEEQNVSLVALLLTVNAALEENIQRLSKRGKAAA